MSSRVFDTIILGGGAAGLFCAAIAGKRGRRVLVIERAEKLGKKILISGGGRCNFTNTGASPKNFLSENPHFCISALSRYTAMDFIGLVEKHGIAYHEKTLGQLFCDGSARQIVEMLVHECNEAGVEIITGCSIENIEQRDGFWRCSSFSDEFSAESLVIATGGVSIPKMGATDFAYKMARQCSVKVIPPRPALVPLVFGENEAEFTSLAGVSTEAVASNHRAAFRESVLFTHRGLSGPVILQISSYWHKGEPIRLNLLPDIPEQQFLTSRTVAKLEVKSALSALLSKRLAELLYERQRLYKNVASMTTTEREGLYNALTSWEFTPAGTAGFDKAEVTAGGIDTRELSSKTMECRAVKGLYFIGEATDVTGWLGGYNFQWAWSSGFAAGSSC